MAVAEHSKLGAEFIGTFMLVFTVGLTLTAGNGNAALAVFAPTAIAFMLMVMIYALAPVSGAHLNPAVTIALWLQNKISREEGTKYIATQLIAGAAAGLSTSYLYGNTDVSLGPSSGGFLIGAPLVEFVYTFMLCFVVLNVTCEKNQPNNFYGIAIGFVIIAGGYGGGYVSGGAFNPAVALGVNAIAFPTLELFWLPIYMACEVAGAIAAVLAFHIVRPEERTENEEIANDPRTKELNAHKHKILDLFDPEDTAECLGAFFLTLSVSLNALCNTNSKPGGNPAGCWSIAASLMCMIFAVGDISGGLFNPAVTIAFLGRWYDTGLGFGKDKLCDPKTSAKEGPKYLIAQFIGGAAGAGVTMLIWLTSSDYPAAEVGPINGTGIYQAFFAELFGTFLLCYVILSVASTKNPLKEYTAFAIGGAIVGAGYAFGPISGGVLNPAVTAANSAFYKLSFIYTPAPILYVLAQALGGVLAAVVFRFLTHGHEYEGVEPGYTNIAA